MFRNPELQRYAWLELTPQRLIVMPIVLALIFLIAWQLGLRDADYKEALPSTAIAIFGVLVGLWGGLKAAGAVIEDVNNNSWDLQRLSSLSPWSLTVGKLFGSTLYVWYGALICLLVYVLSVHESASEIMLTVTSSLLSGLMCHAAALLASMQDIKHQTVKKKRAVFGYFIFGGIISSVLATPMRIAAISGTSSSMAKWYGLSFDPLWFVLISSLIFLGWLVVGIYWQMRGQLKMRTNPLLWLGFLLYIIFYYSGFIIFNDAPRYQSGWLAFISFFIVMIAFYVTLLLEPWDSNLYKRLLDYRQAKNKTKLFDQFPRWLATYGLAVVIWLLLAVSGHSLRVVLIGLSMLVFAARDIALLHWLKFTPNNRRAIAAGLFYLLVLYVLLPLLFYVVGARQMVYLFTPVGLNLNFNNETETSSNIISLLSATGQALLFSWLAFQRWKKITAPAARPAGI